MARPRAAQKQRQLGDVLGLADAAQAALDQRLVAHLLHRLVLRLGELREQLLDAVGLRLAGMDDVDVDVVAVAERGEALGEIGEGRVDRAADQEVRSRRARGAADDIDDLPCASFSSGQNSRVSRTAAWNFSAKPSVQASSG